MEGSGTLGNSQGSTKKKGNIQGSYSTTASDSSTVKIKALLYDGHKPTISANDGKLQIARANLLVNPPHLIHFRNDTSFEDFKRIVSSRYDISLNSCAYHLPGQDLIALSTEEDMKCMIEEFVELSRIQGPQIFKVFKMEGSGTLGNSQASYSITEPDGSTVKINTLFYFGHKPKFSESDGKLQIAEGHLPRLVRLRSDISYEQFKKIICSLSPQSYNFCFEISYYLPGQGLIALATEDMKNLIELFDELNRIQEQQMLKIQQENVERSNDSKMMEHGQASKPQ
ncbi:hypothetical protein FNV43_RR19726 [Rhamnella rubrinervis]|uniref:PB1 domain-containing protein n=1 Tax=Rhamnella rubrinervis TaxID=2594499 RepID=A0A8K0DXD2_9ROSA|nr:hypothetical protein FNV43_RR19726 [Rhamnella rubrinervis]